MHDAVTQAYAQPMLGWSGASYNTITSTLANPSYSATIKLTGTITPNLLLEASLNYDGNIINIVNSPNSLTPQRLVGGQVFHQHIQQLPQHALGRSLQHAGKPRICALAQRSARLYAESRCLLHRGTASMKYGFSYNRYTKNQQLFGEPGGNFTFGTLTDDSMMDMLLGLSSNYDQHQDLPIRHYVNQTPSIYVNDNWRTTPNFSLQLGFRYDALPHAWERKQLHCKLRPEVNTFPPELPSGIPTDL